jgi:peptidyl-tRNA hydrolase, PTH1 family
MVVGLGNPGTEYAGTRHNVGFAVVEVLAQKRGVVWERQPKWNTAVARAEGLLLLQPLTYMNRSGGAVVAAANFYKIPADSILVVLDDFALPLGRIRIRQRGGPGGHNGLESVIVSLGTEEVPRLRLGIGAAVEQGSVDYVLSRFFEEERPVVAAMIERAAQAITCAIDNGVVSAMNTFNQVEEK